MLEVTCQRYANKDPFGQLTLSKPVRKPCARDQIRANSSPFVAGLLHKLLLNPEVTEEEEEEEEEEKGREIGGYRGWRVAGSVSGV